MLSGTSPRVRHTGRAQEPPAPRSLRGHRQGLGCAWLLGPGAAAADEDTVSGGAVQECVWSRAGTAPEEDCSARRTHQASVIQAGGQAWGQQSAVGPPGPSYTSEPPRGFLLPGALDSPAGEPPCPPPSSTFPSATLSVVYCPETSVRN